MSELLALPPPANSERIAPDLVPLDPASFKRWAEYACVEWPVDLMKLAFRTWEQMRLKNSLAEREVFCSDYSAWWSKAEDEKERMMSDIQFHSNMRSHYRRRAWETIYRG